MIKPGRDPGLMNLMIRELVDSLSDHRLHHSGEAGDVGTGDVVVFRQSVLAAGIAALLVNVDHDLMQPAVNFFKAPAVTDGVLAHFETACRNSAGVSRFCGTERYAVREDSDLDTLIVADVADRVIEWGVRYLTTGGL